MLYLPVSVNGSLKLRVFRALIKAAPTAIREGVTVRRVEIDQHVAVLVYERPERARTAAALVWVHGGGYVMGTAQMNHDICSQFAAMLDILVVSVEYRLAPEDPYPAAFDDCYSVLRWLHNSADVLGVDPHRLGVGGASAGGGLAAAIAQAAHDRQDVPVAFQALMYPMLDDRTGLGDVPDGRGSIVWTAASNRFGWTSYLGARPAGEDVRYAIPARRSDLSSLPSAWIGVGDRDMFYDESCSYASRLIDAGVACVLDVERGMFHGADALLAASVPSMAEFRNRMVGAVGVALECAT